MKKPKQQIAKEKLEKAVRVFQELESALSSGVEIKKGKLKLLVLNVKEYRAGLKNREYDRCYNACTSVYKILQVSYRRYPMITEKIKGMLRNVARKFYSDKPNVQMELFS